MTTSVYWIHHKDHTDIFSEGYVGVSSNFEKRMKEHESEIRRGVHKGRHLMHAVLQAGWVSLVKEVVLIADEAYAYMIEEKLRPTPKVGWNIAKGGGIGPDCTGNKHTEEVCQKISESKIGDKNPMRRPEVAAKCAETKRAKGQYTGKEMMEYNASYQERMKDPEFAKQISDKRKKANAAMLQKQNKKMRETVLQIRSLAFNGVKQREISYMFNMSETSISNIVKRKTYAQVD